MKNRTLSLLRRVSAAALALLMLSALSKPAAAADELSAVVSDTYILMDAASGQLLAGKDVDKQKFPASITKILTLGLTLQRGNLDDVLTVSETAIEVGPDAAHIALRPGEQLSVRDAAMATLLASANDAANCLAEYVSGSIADFAELMNRTAERIGCTGSHFVNPSGLPDDDHYTTAHDMARITAWALTVPGFRELFAVTEYTMGPTNLQPESRKWGTQNAMIVTSAFTYEGAWGGKLGWTTDARHTMVTILTREGRDLILVVMDSAQRYEKYRDAALILDTALSQLRVLPLENTAAAPMYSGDTLLGQVPFEVQDLAVWVPQTVTRQQLTENWQLPQRLEVGDTTPAVLEIILPDGDDCLPVRTLSLQIPQGSLSEVQTAWRSLQAAGDGAIAWHTVTDSGQGARIWRLIGLWAGIPAALVLLAYCVRWYNLARRNLRRYGTLRRPQLSAYEEGTRALAALRAAAPGRQTGGKRRTAGEKRMRPAGGTAGGRRGRQTDRASDRQRTVYTADHSTPRSGGTQTAARTRRAAWYLPPPSKTRSTRPRTARRSPDSRGQ